MTASPMREGVPDQFDIDVDAAEREMRVFGEIDMMTAPLLMTAAISMLTWAPGDLMLDLAGVTFADSALLHAIDEIRAAVHDDERELQLLNPSAAVKRLLLAAGALELLSETPDPAPRPLPRVP